MVAYQRSVTFFLLDLWQHDYDKKWSLDIYDRADGWIIKHDSKAWECVWVWGGVICNVWHICNIRSVDLQFVPSINLVLCFTHNKDMTLTIID